MTKKKQPITRRDALAMTAVCMTAVPIVGCTRSQGNETDKADSKPDSPPEATISKTNNEPKQELTMRVHYLEVVTKDVDAACALYSAVHGVTFGDADPSLGGARTASMTEGGMMGVRAPMHDAEKAVTRAYLLVEDIEAAVGAVTKSGAEIAVPPMKIPGHGTCAIYIQDGIEAGLWQL